MAKVQINQKPNSFAFDLEGVASMVEQDAWGRVIDKLPRPFFRRPGMSAWHVNEDILAIPSQSQPIGIMWRAFISRAVDVVADECIWFQWAISSRSTLGTQAR